MAEAGMNQKLNRSRVVAPGDRLFVSKLTKLALAAL
jgi:hypothetical protein